MRAASEGDVAIDNSEDGRFATGLARLQATRWRRRKGSSHATSMMKSVYTLCCVMRVLHDGFVFCVHQLQMHAFLLPKQCTCKCA